MKHGKSIQDLSVEIDRQAKSKRDFVAPLDQVGVTVQEKDIGVTLGGEQYGIRDTAHRQIGEHVKIPAQYYDRMRTEAPALLANNIETWFQKYPAPRMLRFLDGHLRGLLSDRYRALDNIDLAGVSFPVLSRLGVNIISSEITERRFYIKAVDASVEKQIPAGYKLGEGHNRIDVVSPVIIISNSEIGFGATSIETGLYTFRCTNLMVAAQRSMRRNHVGGKLVESGDSIQELLSDNTKRLTDRAVIAQIQDLIAASFEATKIDSLIEEVAATATQRIEGSVQKVIEVTAGRFGFTDTERDSVLKHFIEGGDLTRYGLMNAVTRTAEDLPHYDRATEFERIGGQIASLPANDWQKLAEAA